MLDVFVWTTLPVELTILISPDEVTHRPRYRRRLKAMATSMKDLVGDPLDDFAKKFTEEFIQLGIRTVCHFCCRFEKTQVDPLYLSFGGFQGQWKHLSICILCNECAEMFPKNRVVAAYSDHPGLPCTFAQTSSMVAQCRAWCDWNPVKVLQFGMERTGVASWEP